MPTATISSAAGVIDCNYLELVDSAATGGAGFYAGVNSTDGGGNSGWTFVMNPSTVATISSATGTVDCNYLNLTHTVATGGTDFYAGYDSTDGGGNSGWTFTALPSTVATISKAAGTVNCSYLNLSHSVAVGGATFVAINSTDGGQVEGWTFVTATVGEVVMSGVGGMSATGLREVHGAALFEGVGDASGSGEDYLYVPFRSAFSSAAPTDRLAAVPLSGVP